MALPPWSDPWSAELLALGVDAITAGDARGLTLLRRVLTTECGPAFATTIAEALADGTPTAAFDFLPPPTPRSGAAPFGPPRDAPAPRASDDGAGSGAVPPPRRTSVRGPSPRAPALPEAGYVTVADVAAHFGVSVKAVYRWMATGRIRSERRPGGSYRIPAEQFRAGPDGAG